MKNFEMPLEDEARLAEHIDRARQGDRDSFAVLYERYHRIIYRDITRYFSDKADIEDLAQEVMF